MKKYLSFALFVLFAVATTQPCIAAPLIIQEQPARYLSDVVRFPVADNLMIVPVSQKRRRACAAPYSVSCLRIPVIHFALGSARIAPRQRQLLTAGLKRCRIAKTTPLRIIGYTCPLGTRASNIMLSLHRAESVAGLLRRKGYTIRAGDILAKGENDLVTRDPKKYALNRRVVISHN